MMNSITPAIICIQDIASIYRIQDSRGIAII